MYGFSNDENIFDLTWPLKVKGQGQTPQKLRSTFIPVYNRYTYYTFKTHTKTVGGPLLAALAAAMCSLLLQNCEGSHSVRLYYNITTPRGRGRGKDPSRDSYYYLTNILINNNKKNTGQELNNYLQTHNKQLKMKQFQTVLPWPALPARYDVIINRKI